MKKIIKLCIKMRILILSKSGLEFVSNRFVHTQVVSILMSQKDSGFKVRPLLKALRSAAVMALPPKASAASDEGDDAKENNEVGEEKEEEAVSG